MGSAVRERKGRRVTKARRQKEREIDWQEEKIQERIEEYGFIKEKGLNG